MTASENRRRGKRNEASLARRLGGRRMGITGNEDIDCGEFSIETKTLKRFSGRKIMAQAKRNAFKDKTPIAIIHEPGKRRDNDIVMVRLKDWELLYGGLGGKE